MPTPVPSGSVTWADDCKELMDDGQGKQAGSHMSCSFDEEESAGDEESDEEELELSKQTTAHQTLGATDPATTNPGQ